MCSLYKRCLYRISISPVSWAFGFISVVLSFLGGLFSAGGFFSFFPLVSILLVPAFASILPRPGNRLFLPVGDMRAAFAEVLALLSAQSFFLILSLPVPFLLPGNRNMEATAIVTGLLGLLLFLAAATALCVFFFSLIRNKGAAFAVSSLVLAFFSFAHSIAQHSGLPRFISSFLMAISFSWHEDAASKGILDSRDLIFYLSAFFFFVAASAAAIQRQRGNVSLNFRRQVALAIATLILLVLDSNALYFRLDLTKQKRFSVSPFSRTLLAEADSPLSITYYRTGALRRLYSEVRDIEDFIRIYADSCRRADYEIVDTTGKEIESRLETYGILPQEIELSGTGGKRQIRVFSAITLSYKGRTEVIPFILGTETLEYDLSTRIQGLVRETGRKVHIIVGNGLSLDDDYPYLAPWLTLQGFSPEEEDPSFLTAGKLNPAEMDEFLLLVGASDLSFREAEAVISYIDGGGRTFIATTPYSVDTGGDWSVSLSSGPLTELLMKYGICFKEGMTASTSCFTLGLQGQSSPSLVQNLPYPLWPIVPPQEDAGKGLVLFWPGALDLDGDVAESVGFSLEGLLKTEAGSWQYGAAGGELVTNPFAVSAEALPGEETGSFFLAARACLDGKPVLYVMGDQYALSSRIMAFAAASTGAMDTRGLEFVSDSLLRLGGQGELLKLKKPATLLQGGRASNVRRAFVLCLILPLLLMAAAFASIRIARGKLVHRLNLTWGKSS